MIMQLQKAIIDRYNQTIMSGNDYYNVVNSCYGFGYGYGYGYRPCILYAGTAPESKTYPYCVLHIYLSDTEQFSDYVFKTYNVEFKIYSNAINNTQEIFNITENIILAFEGVEFLIGDLKSNCMEQVSDFPLVLLPDQKTYQQVIRFKIGLGQ